MAAITINAGEHVASTFGSGSLTRQFALVGGLVILATAALAGALASSIVTRTAIENTAAATALFMGSFLSPMCSVSKATRPYRPRRSKSSTGCSAPKRSSSASRTWKSGMPTALSRIRARMS